MRRRHHLRHGDRKVVGQPLAGLHKRGHEQVERAEAARVQLARHRLDPDADERRQRAGDHAGRDFPGRRLRVAIFLGVGPRAIAVLEIEAKILHRLAFQLREHARADRFGQRGIVGRQAQGLREGRRRWGRIR